MKSIATIVEGDGEVEAFPILLRRLGDWLSPEVYCNVLPPIRVRRDRFLNKDEEFSRMLQLAASKCGEDGWICVLLDADDDCPAELGPQTLERAKKIVPHRHVSVVLANREYEAWFLAAVSSLQNCRGFFFSENFEMVESIRGAKEWLSKGKSGGKYWEITDQPAFSARMDLQLAHDNSRSFRKLCSEWRKWVVG
ncbi:DUF4276 family protein [Herbaspirillum sp. RTI4]|uniref:DUF4276 family protein n=1 Tax=Herbaspirillum sp. RTI4 TaxID=3048640 RepID=UPI002AB42B8C|nr:DUF4276 family protein [Herbaspirillum sp. RTI4]MDY7579867.1 DUF4276 family protein [Herbaspirillum sp. RTI4]MEA9981954.1 DUF4276 family protein [Herbaspirillum sp. RTI4]